MFRLLIPLVLSALCFAQQPDPAYEPLSRAYDSLRSHAYDLAIAQFQKAIALAPQRASIHKDLAYTYLKVGENDLAREQFREAMKLDPADIQVAMEFGFLAYESKMQAEARRIFDRVRKTGDATAEEAFQNIDRPLAAGIERWRSAIVAGADDFGSHYELASLAEQRDELALAAEHYEKAWRIRPDRRTVLVDLGRVWKAMGLEAQAMAALLAASRGNEPRAAEMARELLPDRYPYASEFRDALKIDPQNVDLRRELAYLYLRMEMQPEAEGEFQTIRTSAPSDLLSITQLGFLLYARGEAEAAGPLFDRVLASDDDELANRVRAVLRLPQVLRSRPDAKPTSIDAKSMAERSIQAGFIQDALRYLQIAHESDPADFGVMLRLGWTYNLLHQDDQALRWFNLARRSPDAEIAAQASEAWHHLYDPPLHATVWLYPMYSSRWKDLFAYGQAKAEVRLGKYLRPYASVRFIGDTKDVIDLGFPRYYSERAFIVAGGIRSVAWHGVTSWFEAGSAVSYITNHKLPDYRGGISSQWAKLPEGAGFFVDSSLDGVFVSRFQNDFLAYSQSRVGYTPVRPLQFYWNGNITVDAKRQNWANFAETGPGVRVSCGCLPSALWFTANYLKGKYLIGGRVNFTDIRLGIWYAYTSH